MNLWIHCTSSIILCVKAELSRLGLEADRLKEKQAGNTFFSEMSRACDPMDRFDDQMYLSPLSHGRMPISDQR